MIPLRNTRHDDSRIVVDAQSFLSPATSRPNEGSPFDQ